MFESFYNLSESPFRLTPDPRFYFSSSTHKRALTHLRFGFHQREGFVVITGKPGTGKTELMLHLLENLPKERVTYGKIVTSNLDANQTLQQVAAAFHIAAEGVKKGILLKKLEDYFLQQVRENKRLVLIVDEAHKLSINSLNELQMLTNFQLSGKPALQCFLSGHDTLKLNLHEPELLHLKQRVITSTFLTPLEKTETGLYIEHRLRCAGWQEDPKFNPTAYSLIHDVTEGIPRQINALCNRVLLRAYAEQKHYIDESMVSRAIDDVQSEPLATNPLNSTHLKSAPVSSGDDSEAVQANFDRSIQQTSIFKPAAHTAHNDEDETLPLTPDMNNYLSGDKRASASRPGPGVAENGARSVGAPATQSPRPGVVPTKPKPANERGAAATNQGAAAINQGAAAINQGAAAINQEDTLDDARKFSDALSSFHQQTASTVPPKTRNTIAESPATIPNHPVGQQNRAASYFDPLSAAQFARQFHHKPQKTWLAPLAYGSVAFVLIALGVSVWVYNFSADVLGVIEAKNPHDNRFVSAIKGLLARDHTSSVENDADSGAQKSESEKITATDAVATADATSGPFVSEIAAADAVVDTAAPGSLPLKADKNKKTPGGSEVAEEKWDSGALGGKYLTQSSQNAHSSNNPETGSGSLTIAQQESARRDELSNTGTPVRKDINGEPGGQTAQGAKSTGEGSEQSLLIARIDKMLEKNNRKSSDASAAGMPSTRTPLEDTKPPVPMAEKQSAPKAAPSATGEQSRGDQDTRPITARHNRKSTPSTMAGEKHSRTAKAPATKAHSGAESKNRAAAREKSHVQNKLALSSRNSDSHDAVTHNSDSHSTGSHITGHSAETKKANVHTEMSPKIIHEARIEARHTQADKPNSNDMPKNEALSNKQPAVTEPRSPPSAEEIDKAQLNQLLAKLTGAYEKGNLKELLSVLANDVRSNDGSTRGDLKNGYRKLFNITDMRKMTITSVTWSKRDQVIHGKGEFKLHVREKGADTISSYGGIISLDVDKRPGGAVITELNYDYRN